MSSRIWRQEVRGYEMYPPSYSLCRADAVCPAVSPIRRFASFCKEARSYKRGGSSTVSFLSACITVATRDAAIRFRAVTASCCCMYFSGQVKTSSLPSLRTDSSSR